MSISYENSSDGLTGTPSDSVPEILATGRSDVTSMFLSMSKRHPGGADADYLRWHSLDHRPEQLRLTSIRNSLRIVSTPECRDARAACVPEFEGVDHVMTYFFSDIDGLQGFTELSDALRDAGRSPFILPAVQRGFYTVTGRVAAPRMKVGSDVLPWLPVRGVYLILELGDASSHDLVEAPGIAGIWSATSVNENPGADDVPQKLTHCFLDGDPVEVARELKDVLRQRWETTNLKPIFAAPFYCIAPYEWDRYLP